MNIDFSLIESIKEEVLQVYNNSKNIKEMEIKNKKGNDIVTAIDLYMVYRSN